MPASNRSPAAPVWTFDESPQKVVAGTPISVLCDRFRDRQGQKETVARLLSRSFLSRWSGWTYEEVAEAEDALHVWGERFTACWLLNKGGHTSSQADRQLNTARVEAVKALGPIVGAGLARRLGTFLEPTFLEARMYSRGGFSVDEWIEGQALLALSPERQDSRLLWAWLTRWLEPLIAGELQNIRVCQRCSLVFKPSRKPQGAVQYCGLCDKRPPARALDAKAIAYLKATGAVTVRVPPAKLGRSWRTRTLTLCLACDHFSIAAKSNKGRSRVPTRAGCCPGRCREPSPGFGAAIRNEQNPRISRGSV